MWHVLESIIIKRDSLAWQKKKVVKKEFILAAVGVAFDLSSFILLYVIYPFCPFAGYVHFPKRWVESNLYQTLQHELTDNR